MISGYFCKQKANNCKRKGNEMKDKHTNKFLFDNSGDGETVFVFLSSGVRIEGRIKAFDDLGLVVSGKKGGDTLVMRSSVASVVPADTYRYNEFDGDSDE